MLQATQQLLDELPSYGELTETAASLQSTQHQEPQEKQAALWMLDSILATRVQFLMTALGPCLPALPQVRFLPVQMAMRLQLALQFCRCAVQMTKFEVKFES